MPDAHIDAVLARLRLDLLEVRERDTDQRAHLLRELRGLHAASRRVMVVSMAPTISACVRSGASLCLGIETTPSVAWSSLRTHSLATTSNAEHFRIAPARHQQLASALNGSAFANTTHSPFGDVGGSPMRRPAYACLRQASGFASSSRISLSTRR